MYFTNDVVVHGGHGVPNGIPTALRDWWMGLSREENLLDLTPHDHGMECGSGRLFAFVALRAWRESALNYGAPRTKSRWLTATYFG